jgi:serine/threonine-protein phosphatase 2B regulatory subunit
VLSVFDKDGDGKVSFVEYISGLARVAHDESSKQKFLFNVYDLNKDGYVCNGDLYRVVKMMAGDNLSPAQLQQLVDRTIRDWDKDMDGKLNFDEFKAAMSHVSLRSQLELDI